VLLARALCASSKLLVLDEPVTGLDPKVTVEFYQLIKTLNNEGLTIVMVSHDINAAVEYASHILHVEKEQSFIGTTKQYTESDFWKTLNAGKE
jgi:zinc transport system ATP-binding protein